MDANSELADAMLAEYRAFEEYYQFRNADPETLQEKLEAWWAAVKQRRLAPSYLAHGRAGGHRRSAYS